MSHVCGGIGGSGADHSQFQGPERARRDKLQRRDNRWAPLKSVIQPHRRHIINVTSPTVGIIDDSFLGQYSW